MKSMSEMLPSWTQAVGWTLLNSVWQALLVLMLVIFVLRLIPSRHSQARYVFACVALVFFIVASAFTFVSLVHIADSSSLTLSAAMANQGVAAFESTIDALAISTFSESIIAWIESNMNRIIVGWLAGAMFCSLRMVTGWWYVARLKSEASVLTNEWNTLLQTLAVQLNIRGSVTLAESNKIQTPIVLGFIKPIVLVPIGMFSGLTTEQIETIFIHELAHIKRHDYLVNLVQSIIETIFFFNPFVWIISNIIRQEREYCCDDAVIQKQHDAVVYAKALTTLEDVRLSKASFALSLAENKNQLLNRIKRIMEKSVKNYSGRDRLIPALLLVIGLLCASWLTIKSENSFSTSADDTLVQDTLRRKDKKLKKSDPKKVDEKISSTEAEEPVTYTLSMKRPGSEPWVYEFNFKNRRNWEEFREQFEAKFKDKFKDFYKDNSKDFDKLMEEMRENFEEEFERNQSWMPEDFPALALEEWEGVAPAMPVPPMPRFDVIAPKELEELQALAEIDHLDALEHLEELDVLKKIDMDEFAQEMEEHARELQEHARDLEVTNMQMIEMEGRMKTFEREIKKELVKDGYIKEGDEIKSLNFDDNGAIEINGKKMKEGDEKKYHSIHRKYFKGGNFRYVQ
jgi:bla regulator protein blaR1